MFIAVCYDIPDNRRRTRISNILEGFGSRVQESVFECDITDKNFEKLKEKLKKVIAEEDKIRYYLLCAACLQKIEISGGPPVTLTPSYYTV